MSIQLGYRTPTLSDELDAKGKMALANELGMKIVEPQCNPREITSVAAAEEIAEAAKEAGIGIPSVGCLLPLNQEDENLAEHCEFAKKVCSALNCNYVFAVVKNPIDKEEKQSLTWARAVDRCSEAVSRLGDAGISLGIEPDHGAFIQNNERLEELLHLVNDDRLLVNLDICNLYLGGSNPHNAIRKFASRVKSGHIKDGLYNCGEYKECHIGEGELDWAALFQTMEAENIHCPMFIEHCPSSDVVRAAYTHLKAVFEPA